MADVVRPFSCEALINGTWTPPFPTEGADYAECAGRDASVDEKAASAFADTMAAETLAGYLRRSSPLPGALTDGLAQPKTK
jgi:hypothetical protein